MFLNLLREIEDRTIKLGWCLEHGDTSQALTHCAEIRSRSHRSRGGPAAPRGLPAVRAYGLGAGRQRITLVGCGLALVASLSIRSAGIALVFGLAAWLAASWLTDRPRAVRRLKLFLPLLAVAIVAQATWMSWVAIHEVIEWPIGGYPRSYIAQLGVKSGNHPELGAASLADIPSRVAKNLAEHVGGVHDPADPSGVHQPDLVFAVDDRPVPARRDRPRTLDVAERRRVARVVLRGTRGDVSPVALGSGAEVPPAGGAAGRALCLGGVAGSSSRWAARTPRRVAAGTMLVSLAAAAHAFLSAWRLGSRQLAAAAVFWSLLAAGAALWVGAGRLRASLSTGYDGRWCRFRRDAYPCRGSAW